LKVNRCTEMVGTLLFLVMLILVLFQIISRYVFSSPPPWSEEFARWAMIGSVLVFGITITRKNDHILMDFFVNFLPSFPKKILMAVINFIIAVFFMLMALSGYGLIQTSIITNQNAPGSGIPLFYIYLPLPVIFLFMGMASLLNAIGMFREEKRS